MMNIKKEKYCSLCFRAPENGYEVIDNATRIMLHDLTIELNWDSSEDLFMCNECADIVKKSYDFKLISSNTMNRYWVKKDGLRSTHSTASSKSTETDILEEYTTCTLCTGRVKSDKVLSTSILLNDPNIMELYSRCMADIELDDIKGAMICTPCGENFEAYFNFVRNYLEVKEKIDMFFKNETFNVNTNQEKLGNVHNFLFRTTTESSHVSTEIGEIKDELDNFDDYKYLETPCETLKHEEIDIKNDTIIVNMGDGGTQENVFESAVYKLQTQSHNLNRISNNVVYKPVICTYETKTTENDTCKFNRCTYGPQCKNAVTRHKLAHATIPDNETYQCENCTFETNHKSNLEGHILTHKSSPETKLKGSLKRHIFIHKSLSEVKTYKCEICTYETKCKSSLKNHMQTHENISDVETYKCDSCTYVTKCKGYLKRHILIHRSISEVETYKCESCTYETKRKGDLKQHILTHKSISEVKTYKCASCTYEAKRKDYLKQHVLTHKDISNVKTYKCESCAYETNHKGTFKRHVLIHKSTSEVETYKCESCAYETKHKGRLKHHILTHKDISEVETYKCPSCTYETIHKGSLKRHKLIHKSICEVKTYKCTSCSYETKHKGTLRQHIVTHRDISEVKTYKCTSCTYETKRKGSLKRHMLTHKNISDFCTLQGI